MPLSREPSVAGSTSTQTASPVAPSSRGTNLYFEPSEHLPAALRGQPPGEAGITSLSYSAEPPYMTSSNIQARNVSSRLQRLFGTRPVASITKLAGKASTASSSYVSEPPHVAPNTVLAGKFDTVPVSYSEEPTATDPDQILAIISFAGQYLERLAPRPTLDNTWGSRHTSPWHRSAGHSPRGLTGGPINQEMGESAEAIASTIKDSPSGGYSRDMGVGLALAPIARQRENIPAATFSAVGAGQQRASEAAGETTPALDPEALASEVYSILKRRLMVEKERTTSVI